MREKGLVCFAFENSKPIQQRPRPNPKRRKATVRVCRTPKASHFYNIGIQHAELAALLRFMTDNFSYTSGAALEMPTSCL